MDLEIDLFCIIFLGSSIAYAILPFHSSSASLLFFILLSIISLLSMYCLLTYGYLMSIILFNF